MATQRKTNSKISSQAVMEEVKNLAMLGGGVDWVLWAADSLTR